MEEKMAYIFGNYLVEFVKDKSQINGEVFYPGEKSPVGKVTCHFYNYSNPDDTSHNKDDSIHIDILRVQSEHDKKGIGTFLMKKIIEYADKGKIKHVTTTPSPTGRISMENLKKFYLKFRFGSGFLMKKIEFVDEDELLADVIEMEKESNSKAAKKSAQDDSKSTSGVSKDVDAKMSQIGDKFSKTTKANKVACLTVLHFLDDELQSKNDILQIGAAGTNIYCVYLSMKGHNVTVLEPDEIEAENLKTKTHDNSRIKIYNKDYKWLEDIPNESQDAVLCFGPMYQPLTLEEKGAMIKECHRICRQGGCIFISFLSNDMYVMEKTFNGNYDYLSGPKYDPTTDKIVDSKIRTLTFNEIDILFDMCKIHYSKRFAAEGISMLVREKMEGMSEKQFNEWMEYHYKICQNTELLGCSNHVVYIVRKG